MCGYKTYENKNEALYQLALILYLRMLQSGFLNIVDAKKTDLDENGCLLRSLKVVGRYRPTYEEFIVPKTEVEMLGGMIEGVDYGVSESKTVEWKARTSRNLASDVVFYYKDDALLTRKLYDNIAAVTTALSSR
jgi:hypothetical protein